MAKAQHTELARRLATCFDRLAFEFVAQLRSEFDEATAQGIISRTRFGLLDAVSSAERKTELSEGRQSDLFNSPRRRRAKIAKGGGHDF